jgi:hypothetical protein
VLSDYAEQTGIDLARYRSARTFQNCNSADAILGLLEDKAKQFRAYRDGNRKLIDCLKPTKTILVGVDVLLTVRIALLSASVSL